MSTAGYWYEYEPAPGISHSATWKQSADGLWDTVVYEPDQRDICVGRRRIDGSPCCVFLCSDGVYRARLAQFGEAT